MNKLLLALSSQLDVQGLPIRGRLVRLKVRVSINLKASISHGPDKSALDHPLVAQENVRVKHIDAGLGVVQLPSQPAEGIVVAVTPDGDVVDLGANAEQVICKP